MVNSSNLTPPLAVVGSGTEFTADFRFTPFNQFWHVTADFMDDYKLLFQMTEPNPSANVGSGMLIQWHFSGLDFEVADVQLLGYPLFDNRSIVSFDEDNIYIGFDALAAWHSYSFQIVPQAIPEPGMIGLSGVALTVIARRHRRRRNAYPPARE